MSNLLRVISQKISILCILSIFLISCQSNINYVPMSLMQDWTYKDLKSLDPIDMERPDQDMIAVYSRINDQWMQFRIDFLDLEAKRSQDIYIFVDTNPGGVNEAKLMSDIVVQLDVSWEYMIVIPANGDTKLLENDYKAVPGSRLIYYQDITQDYIVLSVKRNSLPFVMAVTKLQVYITAANQPEYIDQMTPFLIDESPPPRAKVLFMFWNTFLSSTPAETIRSWAGAHSGPNSSRHGLKYLLDAAAETKTPLILVDFINPENLSALDYINVLPGINKFVNLGILEFATNLCKRVNIDFEQQKDVYEGKQLEFVLLKNNCDVLNRKYLFNSVIDYAQCTTKNELSLQSIHLITSLKEYSEMVKILLHSAIVDPNYTIAIGGDFNNSLLGEPSFSILFFSYIKHHPWIQVISLSNTTEFPPLASLTSPPASEEGSGETITNFGPQYFTSSTTTDIFSSIFSALEESPINQISILGRQMFSSLTQSSSINLLRLKANYIGQLKNIVTASFWAENGKPINSCGLDLDYDNQNECILANENVFMIIEPEGAYIPFVFSRDDKGIHQLIGPTWEFIVGLSDPSEWDYSDGILSDPSQIPGGVYDMAKVVTYNVLEEENVIVLSTENLAVRKSFELSGNVIHIEYSNDTPGPMASLIPLVVDPWIRYSSDWGDKYFLFDMPLGFRWGLTDGVSLELLSDKKITLCAFNATHQALYLPEDPNYDYSCGHYLPYPMALAEIDSTNGYSLDFVINP